MNLYFDNASTSYPKPREVALAMQHFLDQCSGTYGRGSYSRIVDATEMVETCRDALAQLLGLGEQGDNIFFTMNATHGANTILQGIDIRDGIVLISPLEHNAIRRPLEFLKQTRGITISELPHDDCGRIIVDRIPKEALANAKLIIINHVSNVNGVVQPINEISAIKGRTPLMIDATQSLGCVPIDLNDTDADYLVFTGHKNLHGPTGIGGFFAKNPGTIKPLLYGGTGSRSDSYLMPDIFPDRLEAGTPNMVGIAGLLSALQNRPNPEHTFNDFTKCITELSKIEGITLFHAQDYIDPNCQSELFSFRHTGISCAEMAARLFDKYSIETRQGMHCAPAAHMTLGSFPEGTVRISFSPYHTKEDINELISAIKQICNNI